MAESIPTDIVTGSIVEKETKWQDAYLEVFKEVEDKVTGQKSMMEANERIFQGKGRQLRYNVTVFGECRTIL